jgi:uncharacterized protein YjbI with pentapeptide repeats
VKFNITNRWTGAVIFEAEIEADENTASSIKLGMAVKKALVAKTDLTDAYLTEAYLAGANLTGANLTYANLTGAYLAGANLTGANLTYANLTEAYLAGANLTEAYLTYANLTGANLTGVNLTYANLTEAYLAGANEIPIVDRLDSKILAAIDAGGALEMGSWHTCKTMHCRAGWAITLAGEAGKKLEDAYGPAVAGALIYAKAYPKMPAPNFYTSNAAALADIRARASTDTAPVAKAGA